MRSILIPKNCSFPRIMVILLSFFTLPLHGQDSSDYSLLKPVQLFKFARKCETRGDYITALEYMEQYNRLKNDNPKSIYYLAMLYYKSRQYDSAIMYFSAPLINNDKKFPLRKFYLGSLLMIKQEYNEARKVLVDFRRHNNGKKDDNTYKKLAKNLIIGCDSALETSANQLTAYVYNLGTKVNTEHIEFSPYPVSDKMIIYGSLVLDSANVFSHSRGNAPVRQLYIAEKTGKTWETTGNPPWGINHPDFNTGNATFSDDGQRIYFTRCYQNWKFKTICHIYKIEKTDGSWEEPRKLNSNINTENYTATHPAVGTNPRDGSDVLYFVSDRPGGKGGMDIWYSTFDKREKLFKTPKNLGSKINTCGDEITPYFNTATQTLFYSSNGLPGLGGFDIFQSKGSGRKLEDPENSGTPVNSSYNDLYLALNKDGNTGFFTSNRPGSQMLASNTCCDDIYFFNWKLPKTVPAQGTIYHNSAGKIAEKINKRFNTNIVDLPEGSLLEDVPVFLYLVKQNGELKLVQSTSTIHGNYNFNLERDKDYVISIKNYGYSDTSFNVSTRGYLSDDTLTIEKTGITHVPDIELAFNVYYEPGTSKLRPDDEMLIDSTVLYLLNLLPSAIIEIGSHSDNTGKEEFNLKLSQKRAEIVSEYLVSKGISKERLVSKGYGMSQPIAENDTPEGRMKNRRTQIKIIGILAEIEDIEE